MHKATAMNQVNRAFVLMEVWPRSVCKPEPSLSISFQVWKKKQVWVLDKKTPKISDSIFPGWWKQMWQPLVKCTRVLSVSTFPKRMGVLSPGMGVEGSGTAKCHQVGTSRGRIRSVELLERRGNQRLGPIWDWPPKEGTSGFQSHIALQESCLPTQKKGQSETESQKDSGLNPSSATVGCMIYAIDLSELWLLIYKMGIIMTISLKYWDHKRHTVYMTEILYKQMKIHNLLLLNKTL